jgi:hypothetical protein
MGGNRSAGIGARGSYLSVCCASRIKSQKSDCKALFYPANCIEPKVRSTRDNRDFCVIGGAKIHKRDRLLVGCQG